MHEEIIRIIAILIFAAVFFVAALAYTKHFIYVRFRFPGYVRECEKNGYAMIEGYYYKLIGNEVRLEKGSNGRYYRIDDPAHLVPLTHSELKELNLLD